MCCSRERQALSILVPCSSAGFQVPPCSGKVQEGESGALQTPASAAALQIPQVARVYGHAQTRPRVCVGAITHATAGAGLRRSTLSSAKAKGRRRKHVAGMKHRQRLFEKALKKRGVVLDSKSEMCKCVSGSAASASWCSSVPHPMATCVCACVGGSAADACC